MDEKRIKKQKSQVVFSVLAFTLLFFMEMYAIINYKDNFILSGVIIMAALVVLYILVNGIIEMAAMNNKKSEEQYENILKSEKATYILQKKNFAQMEQRMIHGEKAALIPTEEIVSAQKGIAKVIVGRSKENAEAIMRANDLLMQEFHKLKDDMHSDNYEFMNEEKANRTEVMQQILDKQQQLFMDMKDMELRLNSEIMRSQNMIAEQKSLLQQPVVQQVPIMQPIQPPVMEQVPVPTAAPVTMPEPAVSNPVMEQVPEEPAVEDIIELLDDKPKIDTIDEIAEDDFVLEPLEIDEGVGLGVEDDSLEDGIAEPEINIIDDITPEETTQKIDISDIDLSDPDREMSSDEVDALIASIGEDFGTALSEENIAEPEAAVEEVAVEPELAVEEAVAELEAAVEEVAAEPEATVEEAVAEAPKAPELDLSDPNKKMSPDDIAALIASMGADTGSAAEESVAEPEPVVEEIAAEPEIAVEEAVAELEAAVEEVAAEPEATVEEAVAEEPKAPELDLSDPNKKMSPDDIAALIASMGADSSAAPEESAAEPKPVVEEVAAEPEATVEEAVAEEPKAPELDLSDPNKKMSPDDIAALIASMGADTGAAAEPEPVVEEIAAEPEPVVEEPKAPEIDLSDPNKKMSPDDIAALIASMGADSGAAAESVVEEVVAEPEPVVEEPKAPEIDLSDPNKKMSPDDIAALFAAMG